MIDNKFLDQKLLSVNILLVVAAILFGLYYYWIRMPLETGVFSGILNSIALAVVFLNLPDIICQYFKKAFYGLVTVLVIFGFALSGFFISLNTFILPGIAGILLIYQIFRFSIRFYHSDFRIFKIVFALVFIPTIIGYFIVTFYDQGFHHPLFPEKIITGKAHIDTLFHSAISHIFINYHIPSTGLHGTPYIHYHYGSHILFAGLAGLVNLKPLIFYNLAYPVIFIPLFFKAIFLLILKFQKHLNINASIVVILILVAFSVFLFNSLSLNSKLQPFISESQTVAISFSFFFLSDISAFFYPGKLRTDKLLLPLIYFSITILVLLFFKVSVGLLFYVLLSYIVFRTCTLKSFKFWLFLLINGFGIYVFYSFFVSDENVSASCYSILIKNFFSLRYYIWLLLLCIIVLATNSIIINESFFSRLYYLFKAKEALYLEILIIVSIAGALPGFVLFSLHPTEIFQFVTYQFFLGLAIGIPIILKTANESSFDLHRYHNRLIIITVIFISFVITIPELLEKKNRMKKEATEIIANLSTSTEFNFVQKIAKSDFEKSGVFYIPKDNSIFWTWQKFRPDGVYFIIPAVTGLPQLYSLPDDNEKTFYSFGNYSSVLKPGSPADVKTEAKRLGYKYLYLVNDQLEIEIISL
jgi:hypothetical protein